jgi:hypothetical protein
VLIEFSLSIMIMALVLFAYFIPTTIAYNKKHTNAEAIFALNIFMGWSFIGWVICLVWALMNDKKEE